MEVKIWILSGIVLVLSGVLTWVLRVSLKSVLERLDKMITQNNAFGKALIRQHGEISNIKGRVAVNENRLNDHADRLRKVEINQGKK